MSHTFGVGTYDVTCYASYIGKSRNTGTPEIQIVFYNEEHGLITAYRYVTERAWEYVAKDLSALGWDPAANDHRFSMLHQVDGPNGLEDDPVTPSAIRGAKCRIVTKEESYTNPETGKTTKQVRVQFINGLVPPREEMPEDEHKSFLVNLRKQAIAFGGPRKPAPAAKGKAVPPPAKNPEPVPPKGAREADAARAVREEAVAAAPPEQEPGDYDFENIPFVVLLPLLALWPLLSSLVA